jgi:hypothetical protein
MRGTTTGPRRAPLILRVSLVYETRIVIFIVGWCTWQRIE